MISEQLEQVLKGEHWRDNLLGLEWTPDMRRAVQLKHSHEVRVRRLEEQLPKLKAASLDDVLKQRLDEQHMSDASVVAVLKSQTDRRIKDIGFSRPDDMLLNNFGTFMAALIQPPSVAITGYTVFDISNAARTSIQLAQTFMGASSGFMFQFGSGNTAPLRTNYMIQTPFLTSPEMNRFNCGSASYAGNTISFANVITAGGSGTINEVAVFLNTNYWYTSSATTTIIMLIRDVLGAGISFVAGNPLVASCAIGI